jgi:hypothetical protein
LGLFGWVVIIGNISSDGWKYRIAFISIATLLLVIVSERRLCSHNTIAIVP